MSRSRLPGRFRVIASAFAALVCAFAPEAWAQTSGRNAGAVTIIGNATPRARACSEYALAGAADDRAIETCDLALRAEQLAPQLRAATLTNRGALHLRLGNGDAALADFDAAIESDPGGAEAHLNRGSALLLLNRPGPAVAALTEALSLGVREPHKAYYSRATARETLGDIRGAYEDYSTALEIEPDWGPASAELARFALSRRERLAAILSEEAREAP